VVATALCSCDAVSYYCAVATTLCSGKSVKSRWLVQCSGSVVSHPFQVARLQELLAACTISFVLHASMLTLLLDPPLNYREGRRVCQGVWIMQVKYLGAHLSTHPGAVMTVMIRGCHSSDSKYTLQCACTALQCSSTCTAVTAVNSPYHQWLWVYGRPNSRRHTSKLYAVRTADVYALLCTSTTCLPVKQRICL
jgi:hypothetical protein